MIKLAFEIVEVEQNGKRGVSTVGTVDSREASDAEKRVAGYIDMAIQLALEESVKGHPGAVIMSTGPEGAGVIKASMDRLGHKAEGGPLDNLKGEA